MKTFTLLSAVLVLASGCSLLGKRKKHSDWGESTPAGFRVEYRDEGTVSTGRLTKPEIFGLFDFAQAKAKEALAAKDGVSAETYDLYARKSTNYILVDNKSFPTNDSHTGFAGGITMESRIMVSMYTRREVGDKAKIPTNAPPWTIVEFKNKSGVTRWSYGFLDRTAPFITLYHELGHRILPAKFDHPQ